MAAAVSLGMTRFAYALLLPPMREDLSWTYTVAGSMNTFNAVGYLIGALITPRMLKRWGAVHVLIGGAFMASLLMALTGFFLNPPSCCFNVCWQARSALRFSSLVVCWPPGLARIGPRSLACCWVFITAEQAGELSCLHSLFPLHCWLQTSNRLFILGRGLGGSWP
jgi:MFS family permease